MEVPIEAPREIKKAIAKRLQKTGVLKRIERKIKLGMLVAVEEIREDPKAPGNLERKKFKDASPHETKALQAIYNFLAERNMTYTLSCLLEESSIRRHQADTTDILELLEDDVPKSKPRASRTQPAQASDDQESGSFLDDSFDDIPKKSKAQAAQQKKGVTYSGRRNLDRA